MRSGRKNTRGVTSGTRRAAPVDGARPPGRARKARQAATTLAKKATTKGRRAATTVRAATKAVKATVEALRTKPERKLATTEPLPSVLDPTGQLAAGLSDEERIELAKYLGSSGRPRLFEEERFIFPQSYGVNRVRLLVKDPEWLFAYWDVSARSLADVRSELGDRAAALSRLTLRVTDTVAGSMQVVLLPDEARAWYVRADAGPRTYRAEVGLTLPSGQFRSLAHSNTVLTPASGPTGEVAQRTARYRRAGAVTPVPEAPASALEAVAPHAATAPSSPAVDNVETFGTPAAASAGRDDRGGASDRFGGAAGDKGGASDRFRR